MTFNFGDYDIRPENFDQPAVSGYPGFGYQSKPGPDGVGQFILNEETFPKPQNPTWVLDADRDDPVWLAKLVRILPIIARHRKMGVVGEEMTPFPIYASKESMTAALGPNFSTKTHTQVLCWVADDTGVHPVGDGTLFVLGLWGMTKTISWLNEGEKSRYHNADFPEGVHVMLDKYSAWLSEQAGGKIRLPSYCLFWVDLVPATQNGKPWIATVGTGSKKSQVNPFSALLSSGPKTPSVFPIENRVVSSDVFKMLSDIRRNHEAWSRWETDGATSEGVDHAIAAINGDDLDEETPW